VSKTTTDGLIIASGNLIERTIEGGSIKGRGYISGIKLFIIFGAYTQGVS